MINTASLELCKTLHELSGWKHTEYGYAKHLNQDDVYESPKNIQVYILQADRPFDGIPAYDLGYLLRRLPDGVALRHVKPANDSQSYWAAEYVPHDFFGETADTPEDAAAKLAIELFKQGILKKGDE